MTDRLAIARALSMATAMVSVVGLAVVLTCATRSMRPDDDVRPELIRALRLTGPAIVPAGRPVRQPEMSHPGIDLRFGPDLVRVPPDNADLLLPGP
ncbi:MAG: hypothetical protein JRI25_16865 [Deltaproteobacteria bacterium]|nr:hypothetical protein [Deltaproteobacteria bacterium]MBW2256249.1 hypothetical protein [Deltaproteobacteria bacterium]